jgi:hypothetical protein
VLAIPRVEPNSAPEGMLSPSNQHSGSPTLAATDWPAPIEYDAHLPLPHLAYNGGHMVTEPRTLCSKAITTSTALPWRNQIQPPAATDNSPREPSSPSPKSHGAVSSFALPGLNFSPPSLLVLLGSVMEPTVPGVSMMSTFKHVSTFALPASSTTHG